MVRPRNCACCMDVCDEMHSFVANLDFAWDSKRRYISWGVFCVSINFSCVCVCMYYACMFVLAVSESIVNTRCAVTPERGRGRRFCVLAPRNAQEVCGLWSFLSIYLYIFLLLPLTLPPIHSMWASPFALWHYFHTPLIFVWDSGGATEAADVYSLGVTILELCSALRPEPGVLYSGADHSTVLSLLSFFLCSLLCCPLLLLLDFYWCLSITSSPICKAGSILAW